jgi:Bacterial Ig domain
VERDRYTMVKGPAGNRPPTAAITSPLSGSSFVGPVDIAIAATATDSDGTVVRVDFYNGASVLGSDDAEPFEFLWTAAPLGSHAIKAVATDDDGATHASLPVAVSVLSVSGPTAVSFQNGTNGYNGMVDTTLRSDSGNSNQGNVTSLLVDGSPDQSALLRWNLSSIPTTAVVSGVQLTFHVTDASTGTYEIYALKRTFVEGQATWRRATSSVTWQVAGANGANDRETTVLGTISATALGTYTLDLNAAGVAKVQSWISNPASNFGFVVLDYVPSDGLVVRSSEVSTVSRRPLIKITYN